MGEPTPQTGPRRVVCAVCATEYDDDPDARRIRRCPSCHSRMVRNADGGLAMLDAPPPPPKTAPPARWHMPDARPVLMALGGVMLIAVGLSVAITQFEPVLSTFTGLGPPSKNWPLSVGIAVACSASGLWLIWNAMPSDAPIVKGRPCIGCAYMLPLRHRGRCPECGRLQDPDDPRNGMCPSCRRTLRGFYGDACPECGADVREVVDGRPPDKPLL